MTMSCAYRRNNSHLRFASSRLNNFAADRRHIFADGGVQWVGRVVVVVDDLSAPDGPLLSPRHEHSAHCRPRHFVIICNRLIDIQRQI
jgi:hypothetical protein